LGVALVVVGTKLIVGLFDMLGWKVGDVDIVGNADGIVEIEGDSVGENDEVGAVDVGIVDGVSLGDSVVGSDVG
jgi:hypothetical protein